MPPVDVDVPAIYKNKQFSQEFQLAYDQGPLSGVVGAYYLDANASDVVRRAPVHLRCPASPGFTAFTDGDVDTKTWAVFGDFTYDITDQFSALGRRPLHQRQAPGEQCSARTFIRRRFARSSAARGHSLGFGATEPPTSTASAPTPPSRRARRSASSRTATIISTPASRRASKAAASTRAGQSTAAPDLDGDGIRDADEIYDFMAFEPETVTSYELGWKGSLLDNRIFAGLALFHARL